MADSEEQIRRVLEEFFRAQETFDGAAVLAAWHPGGRLYPVGNTGQFRVVSIEEQAAHLDEVRVRVPGLRVRFEVEAVEGLAVHDDLIASLHVRWRMIMPESEGRHRSFYHLANMDGRWGLVSAVDRGFEVPAERG